VAAFHYSQDDIPIEDQNVQGTEFRIGIARGQATARVGIRVAGSAARCRGTSCDRQCARRSSRPLAVADIVSTRPDTNRAQSM
jgi:hypothetical protein